MIETEALTKRYGELLAVEALSFRVERGEIVGLLGVNGAGKTTLLRVLTGYIPATSGKARVAGHDVFRDSLAVRRKIGYLPENVPLYPELRVEEYLKLRAKLKGVPRGKRRSEISRVLEHCRLADRRTQLIGTLSRGYRQRVGLADALLGPPELLILDEPTSGLDPLQRLEVRALLRELREQYTVLLSTHILPEVEAACGRVLIIHEGRLTPEREIARLRSDRRLLLTFRGPRNAVGEALRRLDGVKSAVPLENRRREQGGRREAGSESTGGDETSFEVTPREKADPRPELFSLFHSRREEGWKLLELRRQTLTLEEIFSRIMLAERREDDHKRKEKVETATGG